MRFIFPSIYYQRYGMRISYVFNHVKDRSPDKKEAKGNNEVGIELNSQVEKFQI